MGSPSQADGRPKERMAAALGRTIFDDKYRHDLAWEAAWLRSGAGMKVDAIERLLARSEIRSAALAELGCGVGAVLEECGRRKLADAYVAVDASADAIAELAALDPGVETQVADITAVGFRVPDHVDLVVVSHVLEHLEEPEKCLRNIFHSGSVRFAVLEVPLEGLALGRLKAAVLGSHRDTSAGHVQCYSRAEFDGLVGRNGFDIVDAYLYAPVLSPEAFELLGERHRWTRHRRFLKYLTMRWLPARMPRLWTMLYHAHYAVLARPRRSDPTVREVRGR